MIIAIDLDEVIVDFTRYFIPWYNNRFNASIRLDDFSSYHYDEVLKITRKEAIDSVNEFYRTSFFKDTLPNQGSKEAISSLAKDHQLVIITSRMRDSIPHTKVWVEKHFPDKFSQIVFTNYYHDDERKITKTDICKDLKVNILIEDNLDFALEAEKNTRILLFNHPWNQSSSLPANIVRVNSWDDVVREINN